MSAVSPSSSPPPGAQPIWGSYSASGQVAATSPPNSTVASASSSSVTSQASAWISGGEPLAPLSRRLLQSAGFLSLLLILVLANSFINSREENPLNPIAAAAERTQTEPGARFTMKAIYTGDALPRPLVGHGTGAFDSLTGTSRAVLKLQAPKVGRVRIETVGDGTSIFMRGTGISGELPGGKEWLQVQPFLGHSEQEAMVGGGDADSALQMLSTVDGNAQELGHEKVHGVPTRRYRTSVELDDYAELLRDEGKDEVGEQYEKYATLMPGPVVGEAWIDGEGLLRRSRMVMQLPSEPGKPTLTMDIRMDLFDFGARPKIALPDPSDVYDATPLLEEQLDEIETE